MNENIKLYKVVGTDDSEGVVFAQCTSLAKAVIAQSMLEKEGFEDQIDIIQDELPLNTILIDDNLVEL